MSYSYFLVVSALTIVPAIDSTELVPCSPLLDPMHDALHSSLLHLSHSQAVFATAFATLEPTVLYDYRGPASRQALGTADTVCSSCSTLKWRTGVSRLDA